MIKIILILLCSFILTSCSYFQTSSDEVNQQLVKLEKEYGDILKTVNDWIAENRFTDSDKLTIQEQIRIISQARKAIYAAKDINDLDTIRENLTAAKDALKKIRDFIVQKIKLLNRPITALPIRSVYA